MDIFETLHFDHVSILETLDELVNQTVGPNPNSQPVSGEQDWATLFHDLKLFIWAHNRAEEAIFYTLLRRVPGHSDMEALEAREHRLVEEFLEDLEKINPQDRDWETKLEVLRNQFTGHVNEEETTVFGLIRPHLEENEARRLAREFESLRDDIMAGAHYFPKGRSQFNPAGLDLDS